jgi:hypothetical protein
MSSLEATDAELTASRLRDLSLKASQARSAIYDLADQFSWETIARDMIDRMTTDEALEFVKDFKSLYVD